MYETEKPSAFEPRGSFIEFRERGVGKGFRVQGVLGLPGFSGFQGSQALCVCAPPGTEQRTRELESPGVLGENTHTTVGENKATVQFRGNPSRIVRQKAGQNYREWRAEQSTGRSGFRSQREQEQTGSVSELADDLTRGC